MKMRGIRLENFRRLSSLQKIAFWLFITGLFYTLAGFFAAPPLLKLLLEKKIPQLTHRPLFIQRIKLNPYTLTVTVENVTLKQKDSAGDFILLSACLSICNSHLF